MSPLADPAIPSAAVDAHSAGMRTIDYRGHRWTVHELDGQLGFVVADLPPVWIDAPRPLGEMGDRELIELVRAELEPRAYAP